MKCENIVSICKYNYYFSKHNVYFSIIKYTKRYYNIIYNIIM
jgi:hypothetical protein